MSSGELPAASPSSGLALLSAKGKQALDTRRETPLGSVITRRACQVSLAPRIWDAQCPPPTPSLAAVRPPCFPSAKAILW